MYGTGRVVRYLSEDGNGSRGGTRTRTTDRRTRDASRESWGVTQSRGLTG